MSLLELYVADSGTEIAWLSAGGHDPEWECKRLVADVDAHAQDMGGMSDLLELSRASAAEHREALRAPFKDDVQRIKRDLQCSKRANVMYTIDLQAMDGRLEDGDAVRREASHELEAGDVTRQEAIRGLEASHCAGQLRGEQRWEVVGKTHCCVAVKGGHGKGAGGAAGMGVGCPGDPRGEV